jgi:hypothetical protein
MSEYFLDRNGVPMKRLSPITAKQVTNCITELNGLQQRIAQVEAEVKEQARLLGISGSAEARLLAENAALREKINGWHDWYNGGRNFPPERPQEQGDE